MPNAHSILQYEKNQDWSLNLLFPSGNTSEDYLRILQNVPTKRAAAYMRGQWGAQWRARVGKKRLQSWGKSRLFMLFKLGLVANRFFGQVGLLQEDNP